MKLLAILLLLALAACTGEGHPGLGSAPIPNAGVDAPPELGSPDSGTISVPGPGPSGIQGDQPTTGVEMRAPPDTD